MRGNTTLVTAATAVEGQETKQTINEFTADVIDRLEKIVETFQDRLEKIVETLQDERSRRDTHSDTATKSRMDGS